ncbi:WD domain G-beta repeat family protein [Babesia bovis T2Bo]|uniref:WD domain G-beta repeat family protein n=1 Tax=Babesia bovis T2Bo TaxID=484906 RepID=UPI001E0D253E|nr:WD domain G-beta repeat family protein [Babesia bovis T2Bo]EDO07155.2 WD domain G-beta repeat family protein [Babesia bovis T2Bo]
MAFKDRFSLTNGMDWDSAGETMVTSSQDKSVFIYSLNKACITNILQSKKHGVSGVRFTNESPRIIVCSSSYDATAASVKLWDTVENRYMRSFSLGAPLISGRGISPHPNKDMMLITTANDTCSLYNYDNSTPLFSYKGRKIIGAFDTLGLIFALYTSSVEKKEISLYDLSRYQAPFTTFDIGNVLLTKEDVVSIDFNPNGRSLVIGTNFARLICINAMNGTTLFACCYDNRPSYIVDDKDLCFPSISPDGRYLLSGCTDGRLSIWNFKGQNVCCLPGHEGPPHFACFNPKKAIISSACVKVAWWLPDLKGTSDNISTQ